MKGATSSIGGKWAVMGFIAAFLLFAVFYYAAIQPTQEEMLRQLRAPTAPGVKELPAGINCPDTMKTELQARASNPLNSSLQYVGVTLYYGHVTEDGSITVDGSATLNSGGQGTAYKTLTTGGICGEKYKFFTLNDANYVAVMSEPILAEGSVVQVDLEIPKSAELEFVVYDSSMNNITATSYVQDTATSDQTMGQGDTLNFIIYARANAGSSQWGSDTITNYICADFDTTKYPKEDGVVLSGTGIALSPTVPDYCASNGYDKAWTITPIKRSEGFRRIDVTVYAGLGDPSNSDIKLLFVDGHYYQDTDGTVKSGIADSGLADIGETNRYITIASD